MSQLGIPAPAEELYRLAAQGGLTASIQTFDGGQHVYLWLPGGVNRSFGSYYGDIEDAVSQANRLPERGETDDYRAPTLRPGPAHDRHWRDHYRTPIRTV